MTQVNYSYIKYFLTPNYIKSININKKLQKVAKVAKYESKNLLEQRLTTINNILTTEKVPKVTNLIYDIF